MEEAYNRYVDGINAQNQAASVRAYIQTMNAAAQQTKTSSAPSNANTEVVLATDSVPPKYSYATYSGTFRIDWSIVPDANYMKDFSKSKAITSKYSKARVTLQESLRGGPWHSEGQDIGKGHDFLDPHAGWANQRWFIDGKQVQVVIGKDSSGRLQKAWEVHVEIGKFGPVYTPH